MVKMGNERVSCVGARLEVYNSLTLTTGIGAHGPLNCTSSSALCPGGRGNCKLKIIFCLFGKWLAISACPGQNQAPGL